MSEQKIIQKFHGTILWQINGRNTKSEQWQIAFWTEPEHTRTVNAENRMKKITFMELSATNLRREREREREMIPGINGRECNCTYFDVWVGTEWDRKMDRWTISLLYLSSSRVSLCHSLYSATFAWFELKWRFSHHLYLYFACLDSIFYLLFLTSFTFHYEFKVRMRLFNIINIII